MDQPYAIISDAHKAIGMWEDPHRSPDRFGDDVDNIQFWVNMVKIMLPELEKRV